ncbi:MAG: hypothetical protein E7077_05065 [Bacteroidales bacterium]|jgi:hypothetical protein|nr:hypothetical protein [Bacteroidales bacterium]
MKNVLLFLLTIVYVFDLNAQTKPAEGDGSIDNPFLISTADELLWLSKYVDKAYPDEPESDACATLTADINMRTLETEWSPIGTKYNYKGVFDGGNHKIDSLSLVSTGNVGLFGRVSSAVIKNVSVYGDSLKSTGKTGYAGGICGYAEKSEITNCFNYIKITGSRSGGICGYAYNSTISDCTNNAVISGDYSGGICGLLYESTITRSFNLNDIYVNASSGGGIVGKAYGNSTILYSANTGSVLPNSSEPIIGGFCGTLSDSNIDRSFNIGYVPYVEGKSGGFVGLYNGKANTTESCVTYCIPEQRVTHIRGGSGCSSDFTYFTSKTYFYNGKACVILNEGLDVPIWAQKLGSGLLPHLTIDLDDDFVAIDTIYKECPNAPYTYKTICKNYKYGDSLSIDTVIMNPDHIDANEDNKCDVCQLYMSSYMKQYENAPFEIGTLEDLVLFKDIVEHGYPALDAVLTDDIDMAPVCGEGTWTSILNGREYSGTFDGKGHVISNYYSRTVNSNIVGPLFYIVADTIKNLTMYNSKATLNSGVPLAYYNNGVIENCVTDSVAVAATGSGLVFWNYGLINKCVVKNMYAAESCAGFATINSGDIRNCCFIGDTLTAPYFSGIARSNESSIDKEPSICNCMVYCNLIADLIYSISSASPNDTTAYNCYGLPVSVKYYTDSANVTITSKEEFASGEICVKLNEGQEQTVWYQTLGVDPYPVLDPTHGIVLYDETLGYYNKKEEVTDCGDNEDDKPSFSVDVLGNRIRVLGVESFLIFDMSGKDVTVKNGELENGIYIVYVNGVTVKVIVKV